MCSCRHRAALSFEVVGVVGTRRALLEEAYWPVWKTKLWDGSALVKIVAVGRGFALLSGGSGEFKTETLFLSLVSFEGGSSQRFRGYGWCCWRYRLQSACASSLEDRPCRWVMDSVAYRFREIDKCHKWKREGPRRMRDVRIDCCCCIDALCSSSLFPTHARVSAFPSFLTGRSCQRFTYCHQQLRPFSEDLLSLMWCRAFALAEVELPSWIDASCSWQMKSPVSAGLAGEEKCLNVVLAGLGFFFLMTQVLGKPEVKAMEPMKVVWDTGGRRPLLLVALSRSPHQGDGLAVAYVDEIEPLTRSCRKRSLIEVVGGWYRWSAVSWCRRGES